MIDPTFDLERSLFDAGVRTIIACDEVGRGALAGPVAVGMVAVDALVGPFPEGLRDSKLVPEPRRELLAPQCVAWVRFRAVGLASAAEIDELGIIACLGLAGRRALTALQAQGAALSEAVLLLDGQHDYLSPAIAQPVSVTTRIKADRDCASVSAASIIAKVYRDRIMIERDVDLPGYGWSGNKGYGSAGHLAAIAELGPSEFHRVTWLRNPALAQPA